MKTLHCLKEGTSYCWFWKNIRPPLYDSLFFPDSADAGDCIGAEIQSSISFHRLSCLCWFIHRFGRPSNNWIEIDYRGYQLTYVIWVEFRSCICIMWLFLYHLFSSGVVSVSAGFVLWPTGDVLKHPHLWYQCMTQCAIIWMGKGRLRSPKWIHFRKIYKVGQG